MGSMEEAAQRALAERRQQMEEQAVREQQRQQKQTAELQEFLTIARSRRFPLESVYNPFYQGRPSELVLYGWVVGTTSGGEYGPGDQRGAVVLVDGTIHTFEAMRVYDNSPHLGLVALSPFYRGRSRANYYLTTGTHSYGTPDYGKLPEYVASYMAAQQQD